MRLRGIVFAAGLIALPAAAADAPPDAPAAQRFQAQGIAVDLTVKAPEGKFQAGSDVRLALHFSDAATAAPLAAASPAAWLSLRRPGEAADDAKCARKVGAFVSGSPIERPDADLTGFAVLALNRDPSLTVIDPQSGYGGSRVLALLPLDSPGTDWVVSQDPPRAYVAEPGAGKIAAIDLDRWRRRATADATAPGGLLLLPGQGLWAADAAGVTLLDADDLAVRARIPTGAGLHRLAASADGKRLFVTNGDDGTVSVVDTAARAVVQRLAVGPAPVAIATSALSGFAYVADAAGIAVLDPARTEPVGRIATPAGLVSLVLAPGGRWGFAADPGRDRVVIFDTVTGRALQELPVADGPAEIAFTQTEAYIRRRGSEAVTLVPLATLNEDGRPAGLADFPAGERPFPAAAVVPAASMMSAPGEASMLLASPNERTVHFYHEGMAAPEGSFDDAGRQPTAVAVLDRSLHQISPGTYAGPARLPQAGQYDVAVLLDAPRLVHCFTLDVVPADGVLAGRALTIEPVSLPRRVPAGDRLAIRFHAVDPATRAVRKDVAAVTAQAVLAPGTWHRRYALAHGPDDTWLLDFTPPEPGIYQLSFEAPAAGLSMGGGANFSFEATGPVTGGDPHG
jgi:YVTN family beta-propeller protein